MAISSALFSSLYIAAISFGAVMVGERGSVTSAVKGLAKMLLIGVVPGAIMGGTVGALKASKRESL